MRRRRTSTRPAARLAATVVGALVLALVAGGCAGVGLPESGPVVEIDAPPAVDAQRASDLVAVPPQPGASALEVVRGFLDAMTASPIRVDVARQFLTESAASEWNPEAATITYADKLPARVTDDGVVVQLSGAERLDATGAWGGRLAAEQERMTYEVVLDDGQYRIANPRDALIVPASWFAQRFTLASRYFFDASARILVPEPVFVPRGDQLASALIGGLLAGPGADLGRVVRSFLPSGLSVGLSVPVSGDGVADIELLGDAPSLSPETSARMLAQLAWTLRQVPGIRALHVTVGGVEVSEDDGAGDYAVDRATPFSPTGAGATNGLFGLQDGVLKTIDGAELQPVFGPFSARPQGLSSVAIDLAATQAAGITGDGTRALVAPVSSTNPAFDAGRAEVVAQDAVDLLPPAWDYSGRLWLVDRGLDGATVSYVDRGRRRTLDVPGVSGRLVKSFLVSRDGTRLVAVVRGRGTDQLRIIRIEVDDAGRVSGATPSLRLAVDGTTQVRINDIAWTSPTTVALLSPVLPGRLFAVSTVTVDGSTTNADALATTVPAPVTGLSGTPVPGQPEYAVTPTGLVDLDTDEAIDFVGGPVVSPGYVG